MKQSMAVNLTKELIQIGSTEPGTFEKNIEVYLHQWLSSLPNIHISEEEVLPQRYNLMAEIPGNPELPAIIFICHMDTVVVGDGWTIPPFDAIEKDRKIFGRGACDMKSGLACCLSAFASAAERAAKAPVLPKRTLRLICSVDE